MMKMKKKFVLAGLLAMCSLGSIIPASTQADDNPTPFADMRDHWAKQAVAKAIEKKYVDGYDDGSFRPENYVTGAEFLKMVVTATKLPVSGNTTGADWYVPYVKAAVDKGYLREDAINTDIVLTKPINRLQMAKIAVRATDPTLQQREVNLNDQGAMFTATSKGLVQGLANGELAPAGSTTRAQSVTIIERILSVNSGEKLETDKLAISNAELAFKKTNLFSMIPVFGGVQGESTTWSPDKLVLETADGKFKGQIDQVVVIDMANPNDPNRGLLGDISGLHWFAPGRKGEMPLIKDYPDSYVILIQSHVDYVKDTQAYADNIGIGFSIYGFESPDRVALANGTLNTLAKIFKTRRGDVDAYIMPKSGYSVPKNDISIKLNAPARPPVNDSTRTIVSIYVPEN
ncbi:S-layer homology domain-containing protein [Paenibacillus athensensis]|nr:S-layer homology domain-containing protein [Paenibacillus athensensis]MCD1260384.1 S-layer homology domain-containing protein [Paenibacillus athensensis]